MRSYQGFKWLYRSSCLPLGTVRSGGGWGGVGTRTGGEYPHLRMLKSPSRPSISALLYLCSQSTDLTNLRSCATRFTDPGWLNLWMSDPCLLRAHCMILRENSSLRIKEGCSLQLWGARRHGPWWFQAGPPVGLLQVWGPDLEFQKWGEIKRVNQTWENSIHLCGVVMMELGSTAEKVAFRRKVLILVLIMLSLKCLWNS